MLACRTPRIAIAGLHDIADIHPSHKAERGLQLHYGPYTFIHDSWIQSTLYSIICMVQQPIDGCQPAG
jgi:hypothetical protein